MIDQRRRKRRVQPRIHARARAALCAHASQHTHREHVEREAHAANEVEEEDAREEGLARERRVHRLAEAEGDEWREHPREGDDVVLSEALPEDGGADVDAENEEVGECFCEMSKMIKKIFCNVPTSLICILCYRSVIIRDTIPQIAVCNDSKYDKTH